MLTRVTLENFFSFGEATTIELNSGVNLLIGINASGKSNFLKALELLQVLAASGDLTDLVWKQWGGLDKVINTCGGHKDYFRLSYEFLNKDGTAFIYNLLVRIEEGANRPVIKEAEEEIIINGMARFVAHSKGNKTLVTVFDEEGVHLKEDELHRKESELPFFRTKLDIPSLFTYSGFDLSKEGAVRQASSFGFEKYLLQDGSNLNTILNHIKNNHSIAYDKLEDQLQKVNPHIKEVSFNVFGDKIYLGLREKNLANVVPAAHISDGTLYYLLLLAICYNPDRCNFIAFDEPEKGLHPDMIASITEALKHAAADGTQLFIATHSPLLLNDFDLEDVFIFEKDKENQTSIKTEEDFPDIDPDHLVGQLWLNGELGGTRW